MNKIQELEKKPLSDKDLANMLGKDKSRCKIMVYEQLKNYTSMEELLPKQYDAAIVLLQIEGPAAPKVGHWIALMNHGDHFEHFDSYGLGPDEELAMTHEHPHMTDILKNTKRSVRNSSAKLQARRESVNTCGRWCVVRVKEKELEQKEFVNFIRGVHNIPDVAVTLLTMHR
jgi:hypothetical protein